MILPELAAVLARPGDPGLRAALGQALTAKGDPRGALIRWQIKLAGKLPPQEREEYARKIRELLAAHEETWTAPAAGWAEHRIKDGLIHAIRADAADFVKRAPALFAVEPVQEVTLMEASDRALSAVAKMPELARLSRLAVWGGYGDAGARALVASPHLASLASLGLSGVGPDVAKAIAKSKLGALRVLCLTASEIGDEGAAALAKADNLAGLERLYLARNELSDEGVTAIAQSKKLATLKVLCLGGNEGLGDEGVAELAKGRAVEKLVLLELDRTEIGDDAARAIAQSKKLASLRRLDLRSTGVTRKGLDALRTSRRGLKVRW